MRGLLACGLVVRGADCQQRTIDDQCQSRPRRIEGDRPSLRRIVRTTGATEVANDVPGGRRFERTPVDGTNTILTWYEVFPGGCATMRLSSRNPAREVVSDVTAQASRVIGFVSRADLARALDERWHGRLRLDPPS